MIISLNLFWQIFLSLSLQIICIYIYMTYLLWWIAIKAVCRLSLKRNNNIWQMTRISYISFSVSLGHWFNETAEKKHMKCQYIIYIYDAISLVIHHYSFLVSYLSYFFFVSYVCLVESKERMTTSNINESARQ